MIPARIVLAVQDPRYMEPLLDYVYGSPYSRTLQVTAFTRTDAFMRHMESGETANLVVGDAEMLKAWWSLGEPAVPWLLLSDGAEAEEACPPGGIRTAKYQPLPGLMEVIAAHCRGGGPGKVKLRGGAALVVGIVSPLGGCGKSVLAMNMAKQLGVLGKRVFYLNLETFNSGALFPSGAPRMEGSFSRLLYDVKAAQEAETGRNLEVTPYIVRHQGLTCDAFEPGQRPKELLEMTGSDTEVVMDSLASSGRYDVIIVDTDGAASNDGARLRAVLGRSGALIWLLLDDRISMFKCGSWFDELERTDKKLHERVMSRSRFIVNRFTGGLASPPPRKDTRIDGVLPYIPSWKQLLQPELLLMSPIYQRETLKLCRLLMEDAGMEHAAAVGGGMPYA